MIYFQRGSENDDLGMDGIQEGLSTALDELGIRNRVLALPPDFTRKHSFAGPLTGMLENYYKSSLTDIMPALGTHAPMTEWEIGEMF